MPKVGSRVECCRLFCRFRSCLVAFCARSERVSQGFFLSFFFPKCILIVSHPDFLCVSLQSSYVQLCYVRFLDIYRKKMKAEDLVASTRLLHPPYDTRFFLFRRSQGLFTFCLLALFFSSLTWTMRESCKDVRRAAQSGTGKLNTIDYIEMTKNLQDSRVEHRRAIELMHAFWSYLLNEQIDLRLFVRALIVSRLSGRVLIHVCLFSQRDG